MDSLWEDWMQAVVLRLTHDLVYKAPPPPHSTGGGGAAGDLDLKLHIIFFPLS